MSGWLTLMLVITIAGRQAARELNVFQFTEVRSVLGFFLLYPLIHLNGGLAIVKTARLPQHVARNLVHYGAQLCWFFALTLIPIGQVVAIEFTMPIWTAILATSFLGERMTVWKIAAITLGLIGVLITYVFHLLVKSVDDWRQRRHPESASTSAPRKPHLSGSQDA